MAELTEEEFLKQYAPDPKASEEAAFLQKYAPTTASASNAIAEQDAAIKEYIAQNTPGSPSSEALSSLFAPVQAAGGLASSIADLIYKGAQGAGTLYGTASAQEGLLNKYLKLRGDLNQTALEVVPRAAYELGEGAVGAFGNLPAATNTLRSLNRVVNPIGAAIQALISPRAAPTEQEALQALELQNLTTSLAQQGEQPIAAFAQQQAGLPVLGETNIDVARAAPLLVGAETLPAAIAKLLPVGKQILRTGATQLTTLNPFGTLTRGAKAAEPYLSGAKAAEAQAGVESAIGRQNALERSMRESVIKEQAGDAQAAANISELRGEAATKGREVLASKRELRTAEGVITPEIVQSQANIEAAAQLPPVILGKTAEDTVNFGRKTLEDVARPIKEGEARYADKFKLIDESLPKVEPVLPAQDFFDAAKAKQGELSEGFEAYNKGEIKRIIDESTRLTKGKSTVPTEIQNLYESATPQAKADLIKTYPDLAKPGGKIPEYTWTQLQTRFRQINQAITQAVKYGNTNDVRILNDLKNGIVDSMDKYASKVGGDTYSLFKDANAEYAAHQEKFGLNRIQTLFKDDVLQNPEMVASKLISFDSPSQVLAIKGIVTPEEFVPVQAQFSKKFFSPVDEVPFDPSHFVKQFSKPGAKETVKAVFGEEGLADFNNIYDASKSFAKIEDLQKTLDNLAAQSEASLKSFSKAKASASEAEKLAAQKNDLKKTLQPLKDADVRSKITSAQAGVDAALTELDRVKNYRDLKNWASRFSGLNIVQAAATSPAWESLVRYSTLHLNAYEQK